MNVKTVTTFAAVALAGAALGLTCGQGTAAQQEADQQAAEDNGQMQCPMMASLKEVGLFADCPNVLLSQEKQLQLTQEQQQRLREIQESAREQARDVLTEEQQEKLEDAPQGRLSMMQLARLDLDKGDAEDRSRMCPMCMRMMRGQEAQHPGTPEQQN